MIAKRSLSFMVILILLTAFAPSQLASAFTITVDSTADEWDAGSCAEILPGDLPGPDGQASLREAICAANNSSGADEIHFAIPGAGVHTIQPVSPMPVLSDDYTIVDGYTQPGSSPAADDAAAVLTIEVDCSLLAGNCIEISSSHNRISGLVINGAGLYGIAIGYPTATYNQISGNFIGLDPSGETGVPNDVGGVLITEAASHNIIGGITPADRNIISGNGWDGVSIWGNPAGGATIVNLVIGNYLGLNSTGQVVVPNAHNGVRIYGNSNNNTIGVNVITGNGEFGVVLAGSLSTYNSVIANYIGLTADSLSAPGNFFHGVVIRNGSNHNTIGGDEAMEGNVISGNGNYGVLLMDEGTDSNMFINNLIGTGPEGVSVPSFQQHGVAIAYGPDNNIVAGGIIAHHLMNGIFVYNGVGGTTIGNKLHPSSIFDNGFGIDLDGEGANGSILPPVITNISREGADVVIEGSALPDQLIFIYSSHIDEGQGRTLIGMTVADASANFSYQSPSIYGLYFNATATTDSQGTSEFSETYEYPIYGLFLPFISR